MGRITALVCVCVCAIAAQEVLGAAGAAKWGYGSVNGPSTWKTSYPKCGLQKQSPIDIQTKNTVYKAELNDFQLSDGWATSTKKMKVVNTGHAAKFTLETNTPTLEGGDLPGKFTLVQFHIHVGEDGKKGAEHTINGARYDGELHFVTKNNNYTVAEYLTKDDGVAVLGIFLTEGTADNAAFQKLIDALETANITSKDSVATEVPFFNLKALLPTDQKNYFRYSGSLTTPTCDEALIFSIFKEPITVSKKQLDELRKIEDTEGKPTVNNYRPVQPLNGRKVSASFKPKTTTGDGGGGAAWCTPSLLLTVLLAIITTRV